MSAVVLYVNQNIISEISKNHKTISLSSSNPNGPIHPAGSEGGVS